MPDDERKPYVVYWTDEERLALSAEGWARHGYTCKSREECVCQLTSAFAQVAASKPLTDDSNGGS